MLRNKLFKETIIYAIGEIAPKVIGFFLLPIYTHYLSPSDYGILSYTNSAVIFLFVLGALSLNSYVLRFYYEKRTEKEKKELIGNIYLFIGFINLSIIAVIWFILPHIITKYNIQVPWKPYFQLALINNFLDGFSIIPLVLYRIKQRAKLFVSLSLGRTLLQFLLTFLFVVVLRKGLVGHYYGKLISVSVFFFIYWLIIGKEAKFNINLQQIKEGLKFSLPLIPGAIAYLALSISDRIILERFVPISDIGVYTVAYTLAFALNMIVQSGYKALEPEFYKRFGQKDFFVFAKKIQSTFLFVVYFIAMGLTLFSQEVFKILASEEYYNGYLLVPIIIIGAIMTGQNVVFRTIMVADKNTRIVGFSSFVGAGISVLFNLLLIPVWGIYAAAISSAVSYFFMNIFLFKKMNFPGKSLKSEFMALVSFIFIIFTLFYALKIEISVQNFLFKILILALYIVLLSKVFHINLRSLKNGIQFKNNN
ncbi:lipopolysaccharide biosynthesis protein [Maribellus maritimus]|uniref:lipopolysaccharide biosynthesis protein n=1 Tax=Maribellus maritimus TaxID=2870838 RepID=UPI001EECCFF9|nr:oligosaccharide flippase family protein [Maribellus maritimus]MCG6191222.1 oligosaccharide flippase family protein [Maribellus maritimus]